MTWVNLHTHSEFSLLDGFGSPETFAKRAADLGQPALALTDHGNLYGAAQFAQACKKASIKPILGCELYVAPGDRRAKPEKGQPDYYHLTVLAQNQRGWRNLLAITADASKNGFYRHPRTDREMLADHREGLIILSGCLGGEVNQFLLSGETNEALAVAEWYSDVFGPEHYYIESMFHNQPDDITVCRPSAEIAINLGLQLVATADCHYPSPEDAASADVLHAIATGRQVSDEKRFRLEPFGRYYLPSEDDMRPAFGPEALATAGRIAEMVDDDVLGFGKVEFPELPWIVKDGEEPIVALDRLASEGMKRRYAGRPTADHYLRLNYEMEVIDRMGFASYFLIVWDYVNWARERGIVCGPRGSAAGSLVLYLLGVSDVDPLAWDLPFERFLNPDRISMPDVDMDFADHRRSEVLAYLIQRYGQDHVGAIIAISTLGARAAIKDTGRALGYDTEWTQGLASLVPTKPVEIKLQDAIDGTPDLKQRIRDAAPVQKLVEVALKLQGTVRHASTHAAGVVVSAQPLVEVVPTQRPTGNGVLPVSQWDMHDVEDAGLIKFDFLGLANLSMIERCLVWVGMSTDELLAIPQDDPKVWESLQRGETKTVFQLEGRGMSGWLVQLEPTSVEHLAAMVALYRPGPMLQIPSYIERRHGREEVRYPHPDLADILAPTYGIPVYQEQVMAISRAYAGYTGGQADTLRKVMGKKLKEEVAKEHDQFLERAEANGRPRDEAEAIWAYVEPFAGYGFNRSHAVCYAIIAYQTAWLKVNYPAEWMAAVLATDAGKPDKLASAIGEARRMKLPIYAPDVNYSQADFVPIGGGVRYGLEAVKGLGHPAVLEILYRRTREGSFRSLDDFCSRVDLKLVNRRAVEALIKCGAFDSFGPRPQLLAGLDAAMFRGRAADGRAAPLPTVPPVPKVDQRAWEKEALGLYVTDHPFYDFDRRYQRASPIGELEHDDEGKVFTIAGYASAVRTFNTKRGDRMAIVTLDDLTGQTELVVFPRLFSERPELWVEGHILVVRGKVDIREGQLQILADGAKVWVPEQEELRTRPVATASPTPPTVAARPPRYRVTIEPTPAPEDMARLLALRETLRARH